MNTKNFKKKKSAKAISSIITVVLLIVLTFTLVALFFLWIRTNTSDNINQINEINQLSDLVCSDVRLKVSSAKIEEGNIEFFIENISSIDIQRLTLFVRANIDDQIITINGYFKETLEQNQRKKYEITTDFEFTEGEEFLDLESITDITVLEFIISSQSCPKNIINVDTFAE